MWRPKTTIGAAKMMMMMPVSRAAPHCCQAMGRSTRDGHHHHLNRADCPSVRLVERKEEKEKERAGISAIGSESSAGDRTEGKGMGREGNEKGRDRRGRDEGGQGGWGKGRGEMAGERPFLHMPALFFGVPQAR